MEKFMYLAGRVLVAHIFLLAGVQKIGNYAGTQGYMESMGVPGMLLPLVILAEVGGALALIVGWQTRWAAAGLALFCLLSAVFFHTNFSDGTQMIMFMKNLSIAGGLLFIAAHGAGAYALDVRRV
ncbi:MAG: DoxX family protein [Gammaproteobacteria bacterium]|nr:DoxX family protein [Gammaproteobacteria bacterium]